MRDLKCLVFMSSLLSTQSLFVLEGSSHSYTQFREWRVDWREGTGLQLQFQTQQTSTLLLYADNISNCTFIELKVVRGRVQLRFDLGGGAEFIRSDAELLPSYAWNQVSIKLEGRNVTLTLNSYSQSLSCDNQKNEVFPNVYIGGTPLWLANNIQELSLPSVIFEPKFRGQIRNVVYTARQRQASQQMLAYKGVRASDVDQCTGANVCKNNGICISTDQGPICDCSSTQYTGKFCENENKVPEILFDGRTGLTLSLMRIKGHPILSTSERISLSFKTRKSSGIIFYAGHLSEYVFLYLQSGLIRLAVNLNSGKFDTSITAVGGYFNDNSWHNVSLRLIYSEESVCQLFLKVDGRYQEKWRTPISKPYHLTSKVLLGGNGRMDKHVLLDTVNNLAGCMKQVIFEADSVRLDLIGLAKSKHPTIQTTGEPSFTCQDFGSSQALKLSSRDHSSNIYRVGKQNTDGRVISFTDQGSFLMLPHWTVNTTETISLSIKTTVENGLLLFSGKTNQHKDEYFAMELFNGYIFLYIRIGGKLTKIQASQTKSISDGHRHQIEMSLRRNQGRLSIDQETEVFTTHAGGYETLSLNGPVYLGGFDYLENEKNFPPEVRTMSLQEGLVGCVMDLYYNNKYIDIVHYAHEQNSGSIRSSCHNIPGQCYDRPCQNGGICHESWNRYECDCTSTSFIGPTCSRGASTLHFTEDTNLRINFDPEEEIEILILSVRFRTQKDTGTILASRSFHKEDRLEMSLEHSKVKIMIQQGLVEKTFYLGQSLNDDIWHTVRLKKAGKVIESSIDDDDSVTIDFLNNEPMFFFGSITIGNKGHDRDYESFFVGRIQQVLMNTRQLLEETHQQQLQYEGNVKFQYVEDMIINSISFMSHHTYLGMPQIKVYNMIDIFFKFKTSEANGLILYNAGKNDDFIAIELINGHIQYTINMGFGHITLKDNVDRSLADNKYHSVSIKRPNRYSQVLIIDNYHKVSSTGLGDNYYLNLDGIFFLGGVKTNMYRDLPVPILSKMGYQGCLSNFEINGESINPNKDALVTSSQVSKGCQDSYAYEFYGKYPGIITYKYPDGRQPDTKSDSLSAGFITGQERCTILRIDSAQSNDFLEVYLDNGHVIAEYNLGTESIILADNTKKFNDGNYHVLRFNRVGPNSTLQLDNRDEIVKIPDGRHLTVFNSQNMVQIGGRMVESKNKIDNPFQGVLSGVIYNKLHLLELAFQKREGIRLKGTVNFLQSIPSDYKQKIESMPRSPEPSSNSVRTTDNNKERSTVCDDDDLCEGSGGGPGTAGGGGQDYGPGVHFPSGGFMPCDDDEDICDNGSGGGEGGLPGGGGGYGPGTANKFGGSGEGSSSAVTTTSLLLLCALLNSL